MTIWDNPALIGLAVGLPSFLIGYLTYRQSVKVDRISQQSGAAGARIEATAQVIEGLNKLIDNLQEDNQSFRDDLRTLGQRLAEITVERDQLKREVNRLYRKYGENGDPPRHP